MDADEITERALAARRKPRLEYYEREIEKRCKSVAEILRELRDDPLKPYLATHDSIEHYLEERWKMTPRRQQQLTAAQNAKDMIADQAPDIAPIVLKMKEGQMRELTKVPEEKRVEVLRAAIARPEGKLTSTVIKRARAAVVDSATGKVDPKTEQLELQFCITAPPDDIEWFKSLTKEQRGAIVSAARQQKKV